MAKRGAGYANQPHAPAKAVASRNPMGTVEVGARLPRAVPNHLGRSTGLVPFSHAHKPHLKHKKPHLEPMPAPKPHKPSLQAPKLGKRGF